MQLSYLGKREVYFSWLMFVVPAIFGFFNFPAQYAITSCFFICIALTYSVDKEFRRIVVSFPLLIWLALTLYHWINARYKHVVGVDFADLLHGLKVYFCICIVCFWATVDFKKTIRLLLKAYLWRCFFVIALLFLGGYSGGRLTGAGGSATGLGQMAALIGIYIAYSNIVKKITLQQNVLYYALPFLIVILSQSRNSLVMIAFSMIACFFAYNYHRRGNVYTKFIFSFIIVISAALISMPLLEQTSFGQRAKKASESAESGYFYANNATNTVFDKIVGDRLVYYIKGWDFFQKNPWTGIGMWNYRNLTAGRYPLHSEYMVHLCEGGVIAVVLWLSFLIYVIRNLMKLDGANPFKKIAIISVVLLLFCGIYAREFFYEMFYPPYALCLTIIRNKEKNKIL